VKAPVAQVAVLADSADGTSYSAVVARNCQFAIKPAASFEEAIRFVKERVAREALIPGNHSEAGGFCSDAQLRLMRTFEIRIPALVLATNSTTNQFDRVVVDFREVTAHATTGLFFTHHQIPMVNPVLGERAALSAVRGGNVAWITNSSAARAAGLKILRILQGPITTLWAIFASSDVTDIAPPPSTVAVTNPNCTFSFNPFLSSARIGLASDQTGRGSQGIDHEHTKTGLLSCE
jgi:hypothetical protein